MCLSVSRLYPKYAKCRRGSENYKIYWKFKAPKLTISNTYFRNSQDLAIRLFKHFRFRFWRSKNLVSWKPDKITIFITAVWEFPDFGQFFDHFWQFFESVLEAEIGDPKSPTNLRFWFWPRAQSRFLAWFWQFLTIFDIFSNFLFFKICEIFIFPKLDVLYDFF